MKGFSVRVVKVAMLAMCLACGCNYCPRFTPLKPGTEVFLSQKGVTTVHGVSSFYDVSYGTKFRVLNDNPSGRRIEGLIDEGPSKGTWFILGYDDLILP
jgi:hypothetical protein